MTSYSLVVKIIAEKPFTREVEGFLMVSQKGGIVHEMGEISGKDNYRG